MAKKKNDERLVTQLQDVAPEQWTTDKAPVLTKHELKDEYKGLSQKDVLTLHYAGQVVTGHPSWSLKTAWGRVKPQVDELYRANGWDV